MGDGCPGTAWRGTFLPSSSKGYWSTDVDQVIANAAACIGYCMCASLFTLIAKQWERELPPHLTGLWNPARDLFAVTEEVHGRAWIWTKIWLQNPNPGASLLVQWLGVHLPVKWTWVPSLVPENPTCFRATQPMCHNYWACEPWNPRSATRETTAMRSTCTATTEEPSLTASRESWYRAAKTQHDQK